MRGVIAELKDWHGFIVAGRTRYFFFHKALEVTGPKFHELGLGQEVEFIPIDHPKGPRAIEIRVING